MTKTSETLATNLRVIMARDRISITKLYIETGVARSTITAYRNGDVSMVNLSVLEKLANYLNVTVSTLFKEGN